MLEDLDFPATGIERSNIIYACGKLGPPPWDEMTDREKHIYVYGMWVGHSQGVARQAKKTIDTFTLTMIAESLEKLGKQLASAAEALDGDIAQRKHLVAEIAMMLSSALTYGVNQS